MITLRNFHRTIAVVVAIFVAFQVASGLWLVRTGWKSRSGWIERLKVVPGAYLALFAHFGFALSRYVGPALHLRVLIVAMALAVGAGISTLILAALMGQVHPYEVPQHYKATYQAQQTS